MKRAGWLLFVAVACLGLLPLGVHLAHPAQAGEGGDAKKTEDETTIRKLSDDFARALSGGDAKQVAALFTDQGEYVSDDGTVIRGKPAIEKAYKAFLEKNGHPKVELTIDSIEFPSHDTALVQGTATVHGGKPNQAPASDFETLYVRENGQWRLARLRETPEEGMALDDLDWLIGSWVAKTGDIEVHTKYSWDKSKNYILATFTIKGGGRDLAGTQRIARDPSTGQLRSWLFGNDGDFGESTWTWDGKRWLLEATGVEADGSVVTALNIVTPLDNDSFTWWSTKRTADGEELPDLAPIKVTRVK